MGVGTWALKYRQFLLLLLYVNVHALKNTSYVLGCVIGCLAPAAGNSYIFQSSSKPNENSALMKTPKSFNLLRLNVPAKPARLDGLCGWTPG